MPNQQTTSIRKAVFPVAGLGTRFLPATKATPKEMLPIIDKPIIQYAVEEAIHAGITELIFITRANKRAIEDHFDSAFELEQHLEKQQDWTALKTIKEIIPPHVSCIFTRQKAPLGLGDAISCAKSIVGKEPFAVILADDLIDAPQYCLSQMVEKYHQHQGSILAVETVALENSIHYGMVSTDAMNEKIGRIDSIIEKPQPEQAPSNLGVVGRYILEPRIFDILDEIQPGRGGEIQLTDGISQLLRESPCYAFQFEGERFDCGNKLGYLEAIIHYALMRDDLKINFEKYLKEKYSFQKGVRPLPLT